MNKKARLIRGT